MTSKLCLGRARAHVPLPLVGRKKKLDKLQYRVFRSLKVLGRINFPGTRCVWSIYLHEWLVCLMVNVHSIHIAHRLYNECLGLETHKEKNQSKMWATSQQKRCHASVMLKYFACETHATGTQVALWPFQFPHCSGNPALVSRLILG